MPVSDAAGRPRQLAFIVTIPARPHPTHVTALPSRLESPRLSQRLLPTFLRARRTRSLFAAMSANERSDDSGEESSDDAEDADMKVFRKGSRKPYQGDLLPFDVSVISPPPSYLGRFQLDPRTHCGDVVGHDGRQFVVKKVRMQYKYSAGSYKMVKKTIEVKSLARKALESHLEKILNES